MTPQTAQLLANQRTNAEQHGDLERIEWWANRDTTTPDQH